MMAPTLDPQQLVERSGEEGFSDRVAEWTAQCQGFRVELLSDLIVGVEGLTVEDKAVDLSVALEFILENEALREEIFNAIVAEGTLTAAEEKV